jgi:glycosyltransferase involved in cell wall biosynthesis
MSVSIIIPTYYRKKFEKLISHNINIQTYRHIIEVVICDDGKDETLDLDIFYNIQYIKLPKRISIGEKRNLMARKAKGEYIVHMDDDDFYNENYINYGIMCLQHYGKNVFGSSCMFITYPHYDWKVCLSACSVLNKANEATFIYKKSFWAERGFSDTSENEGQSFLSDRMDQFFNGNIEHIMVCVAHNNNTISKDRWLSNEIAKDMYPRFEEHKKIYIDNI